MILRWTTRDLISQPPTKVAPRFVWQQAETMGVSEILRGTAGLVFTKAFFTLLAGSASSYVKRCGKPAVVYVWKRQMQSCEVRREPTRTFSKTLRVQTFCTYFVPTIEICPFLPCFCITVIEIHPVDDYGITRLLKQLNEVKLQHFLALENVINIYFSNSFRG